MDKKQLISDLTSALGEDKIRVGEKSTEHFRTGWRSGGGSALAVVFPETLVEFWLVLKLCVAADCIMIMQAANTGLTEGSTPSGDDYDRDIVIINTLAMNKLLVLGEGEQVISFPGTTLHTLEKTLKPLNRAPHSVIGSSCLGASIVGGIANNSGGALVKRGPAYTELSLYAWVNEQGQLELVNHLGIDLGDTPEQILANLEAEKFSLASLATQEKASASDYLERLRDVDADTPSRFNADTTRLYEASGCAGKVAVFAVRLDTFEVAKQEQTYYIGTNNPDTLTHLRRHILSNFKHLPEVGEYMHRDIFDIAAKYGKDTFLSIEHLGTDRLPKLFALKGRVDATLNKVPLLPKYLSDRVLQVASKCFPQHLPERMLAYRDKYEHHLILKMSDEGIAEASSFLASYFKANPEAGDYFECQPDEAAKAYLQRFAAAGAAIRYQTLHDNSVGDILALDIALRRNDPLWQEQLPASIASQIDKSLYYGHFFCYVFHQDYVLKKGADAKKVKKEMLALLDSRGAKYPAEHNVGHLYEAEPGVKAFYQQLDPTNSFNPGVGQMDKHKRNCACC
ncbi:D-lactate dehydrogenase [Thalassotalea euphylliae]|uniref:Quinone-dependent D-lactate dehydrogenase n=1 Tax=Thalassotalea euphylliae TaxID=1655234 RepID=A0A3E0TYE7_9GAMM|nr:D-lactate dehydrogenase [Thalassotalea euphylliae]REL29005.1 D-lactate dehydrogenase [Thalassotalea euphylliae]